MNKICTTVKQSRKLIELGIDVNTADMRYMYRHWEIDENTVGAQSDATIGFDSDFYYGADNGKTYHYIPAWSLTALLGLMSKLYEFENDLNDGGCQPNLCKGWDNNQWHIVYRSSIYITESYDDPIDAAFEMVCWLLENKKI